MKVEIFKNIIKEAVKEAIKEVLLSEQKKEKLPFTTEQSISISKVEPIASTKSISSILQETQNQMSNQDYRNIIGENELLYENTIVNESSNQPGLDLTSLDFVKKSATIFKKSIEISNQRGL